ncbi:MAG TPA: oxygen-independent coproporphyrinogen III oxidase [Bacteroidales bacterium]|nr:oxygen-independent coproporphyrinogen III oxidase [Bacteroidales bacterium]
MQLSAKLLEKYNIPTPRYTSYPPANYFNEDFSQERIVAAFAESNLSQPQNISFYIHIPFCGKLCYYCGCNTHISKDQDQIKKYVETLKKEILMFKKLLDPTRKISQIHWGGGTPNYLPIEEVEGIMAVFVEHFAFIPKAEIAMECHPAHLSFDYIDRLVGSGINRVSLGVQDFESTVMKAVNRDESIIPIAELIQYIKSKGAISVNLDFVYGLPFQTTESFQKTIEKATEANPDRLAIFSYAHIPWLKKAQQKLERYELPSAEEKTNLFDIAYKTLTSKGYVSIGLDHFAKPQDELSLALQSKSIHRNFQGYCTRETTGQVYALGVSGISQLENAYIQNTKSITSYIKAIDQGSFAIEKAYFVDNHEKIIREVINEIMCNNFVSLPQIAAKYHLNIEQLKNILTFEEETIHQFEKEGLLTYSENRLEITAMGQFFMRNIAASFDPKMKTNLKSFSKAL